MKEKHGDDSQQFKQTAALVNQTTQAIASIRGGLSEQSTTEVIEELLAIVTPESDSSVSGARPVPVIRQMVLCEDWWIDPTNQRRISIIGLVSHFNTIDDPPYPAVCEELCVFLSLTEGRGQGMGKIVCTFEESGEKIWESPERMIEFGPDPLEVTAMLFRLRQMRFPCSGRYLVQFWYDGVMVAERPLC
jgi:hypothetical protein